ncbi:hypothetical protein AAGV33_06220 [Flavobacterium sp. FBOR7N2.3]|uniref:DUF4836 domain-containing protein n=1 Tax=Flavobacterium magnesitis TaxID=3138077 RepID=A0ABV4TM72_9FLAO
MKRSFYLLFLLFGTFSFAQINTNDYDFFVQYNGDQLSQKVSVTDVLNHSLLKSFDKKKEVFTIKELDAVLNLNQNVTFYGNFTDSISFTQVTIPLKNSELLKEILLRKKESKDSTANEQITEIIEFENFSMVKSDSLGKKGTIAWNKDYMVIFEITNRLNYTDYISVAPPLPAPSDESPVIIEDGFENTAEDNDFEETDQSYNSYLTKKATFEKQQTESQEEFVKSLFDKGFVAPYSDKINAKADISAWVNYSSFLESTKKMYGALSALSSLNNYFPKQYQFGDFVKGINLNAYFDNDNVRLEETIEYNEEMAKIMQKITNRKINKKVYSYFPTQKPLAYLSYHLNTKEILTSVPSFTNQIFGGKSEFKEDVTLIMDLITTLVDEEATSTLFDGDFSLFFQDMTNKEVTKKTFEYDENYERKEVEKTTTKSIPLFSMVFTSTHPTFGDKLINLGIRKGFLKADGDLYYFTKTSEYGAVFVLKDKDVIVIGNISDDFNGKSNADFAKDVKRELKKNSLMGAVDFEELAKVYQNEQSNKQSADNDKYIKLSHHFNSLEMHSPKKLKKNTFSFDMQLNSTQKDKNIILQFLDAVQEMK